MERETKLRGDYGGFRFPSSPVKQLRRSPGTAAQIFDLQPPSRAARSLAPLVPSRTPEGAASKSSILPSRSAKPTWKPKGLPTSPPQTAGRCPEPAGLPPRPAQHGTMRGIIFHFYLTGSFPGQRSAGRGGYMICAPYPRRINRRGRKNGNLPLAPPEGCLKPAMKSQVGGI